MNRTFLKFFFCASFVSIFLFVNCTELKYPKTKEDCEANQCLKITIFKNGTINKTCIKDPSYANRKSFSLEFNETFIIYDCLEEEKKKCKFNISSNSSLTSDPSVENCKRQDTEDKDSICCYYLEKNISNENTYGCREINKYEFERFKWGLNYDLFQNYKFNINGTEIIGEIECNGKNLNLNKIIFFFILLIFLHF